MIREGKGSAIKNHVDNYCVVDLETTGIFISSALIIEISAIKVRDNQIVDEFSTLVNPQSPIPPSATAVNHITDEMVKDSPTLNEIIDSFMEFLGEDVIIGYNNAGFDMNLIYDALMKLRGKLFSNDYIDILHSARRCLPELDNHKLETLSIYYSLNTEGEHRALKDCYLTKDCYDNLYREFGDEIFGKRNSSRRRTVKYSSETLALQELQSLLEGIIEDGKVTEEEFSSLKFWMEEHRDLQGNYPFDRVFNALDQVLEDGIVTMEELDELQELFVDFVDPVKSRGCHNAICSILGKHVCITGDFDYGTRSEVFSLIEEAGGIIDKGVKRATNYVVVGAQGSDSWKTGNYGGKIQKAMELKDKGFDIEIVEECEFIPSIQSIIENNESGDVKDPESEPSKNVDWKQNIREMLEALIEEFELPANSLYLSDNYGKGDNTRDSVISNTVCIWEPSYPAISGEKPGQNKLVATIVPSKIKSRPDDLDISLREIQEGDLRKYLPEDAEVLDQTKTDIATGTVKVRIRKNSAGLTEYIKRNTIYCIQGYESKASRFGCCSSFEKCSDAKKCVHENKLYSKACMYRDNLDQGRIFYGKNRNVDGKEDENVITQEVQVGDSLVVLDSSKYYIGKERPDDEEKLIRKAVGLPVTKQLVYYKDKLDAKSIVNVVKYRLVEMYEISDRWYTVEITTSEGEIIKIHSDYLAEMQKPSFIEDMASQVE